MHTYKCCNYKDTWCACSQAHTHTLLIHSLVVICWYISGTAGTRYPCRTEWCVNLWTSVSILLYYVQKHCGGAGGWEGVDEEEGKKRRWERRRRRRRRRRRGGTEKLKYIHRAFKRESLIIPYMWIYLMLLANYLLMIAVIINLIFNYFSLHCSLFIYLFIVFSLLVLYSVYYFSFSLHLSVTIYFWSLDQKNE